MIKPGPPKITGIAGLTFLFCGAGAGAGLLFDALSDGGQRIGAIAQPGAHGVLGVGLATAVVIAAYVLRLALGRRITEDPMRGGRDAGHSA